MRQNGTSSDGGCVVAALPGSNHRPFGRGLVLSSWQEPSHAPEKLLVVFSHFQLLPWESRPRDWKRFPQEPKRTGRQPGEVTQ